MRGLSEGQKTCLSLVAKGMSSKEIARETGLTPRSVDTYLTDAISVLGASNRRDAARIYLASGTPSQQLQSQPGRLAPGLGLAPSSFSAGRALRQLLFPIPAGGGTHELTKAEKLLMAGRVSIASVILLLTVILVFIGLLKVF